MRLKLDRIRAAASVIDPVFLQSPQFDCKSLNDVLGCHVTLKVETMNPIRCFKGRGTDVAMANLAMSGGTSVVCASAGNLGQAMAYIGRARGLQTTVIASADASSLKLERIQQLGASVQLVDGDIEIARQTAREFSAANGSLLLEDSENTDTCEGAGTVALELLENSPSFDAVLVALGGGALATGIGLVLKTLAPSTDLICVQPELAPAMTLSWRANRVVETDSCTTIADGVAGRFPSQEVLADLIETADDCLLVAENSIISGMQMLFKYAGLVVEPSAALGIAAIIDQRERFHDKKIATIICGSNTSELDFRKFVLG